MTVMVPPEGDYVIDPSSSVISFKTKHMFGLGGVTGKFNIRSGGIRVASPVTDSRVEALADASSFATGNAKRDEKVLSGTFLDAGAYPDIAFESGRVVNAGGRWTLQGTLTARGVKAPVEFAVTESAVEGRSLKIVATANVDRYAHGITAMKGMAGRHLQLTATIYARR
jgi:polyisoprenoid-binding protein YceI